MSQSGLRKTGIGLRAPHMGELLESSIDIGFLEAHTENYFTAAPRRMLEDISKRYPVTLHGVGLSLGRADGLDRNHLQQIASLVSDINPLFVSEHLSWSSYQHVHVPDLLPVPFTNEALNVFVDHVQQFQDEIGRQVLIENPSNYLAFAHTDYSEPEFLNALVGRSGCGLLLDINNIAVSAHNLGYDAQDYIDHIVSDNRVQQFHLAGYQRHALDDGQDVLIDTHGAKVYDHVWDLYAYALRRFGDTPTLIEWDTDIPALTVLLKEAQRADAIRRAILEEEYADIA